MRLSKGLNNVCRSVVVLLWAAICLTVLYSMVGYEAGRVDFSLVLVPAFAAAIVISCIALLRLNCREEKLLLAVMALSLAARLAYVLIIPSQPASDFMVLYRCAQWASQGDFDWVTNGAGNGYFGYWPYQIPFVLYEAVILKLFKSMWALKAMNLVFMLGINYLIYKISALVSDKRAALCAAFIYAVYPSAVHMSSVLTNQHISTFFLLWGLYLILSASDKKKLLAAGLLLGISNLMRPEGTVILIALACCGIWYFLQAPSKRRLADTAVALLLIAAGYVIINKGLEIVLILLNIAPYGIGSAAPEWKFVLGLDFTGNGTFSGKNVYVIDIADDNARREETIAIIQNSWNETTGHLMFFLNKIKTMWAEDIGSFWAGLFVNSEGKIEQFLTDDYAVLPFLSGKAFNYYLHQLTVASYGIMWLLGLPAVGVLWHDSAEANRARLPAVILIGFFVIYLAIEVQARYRYELIPLLAVLASCGMTKIQRRQKE